MIELEFALGRRCEAIGILWIAPAIPDVRTWVVLSPALVFPKKLPEK
jgi:hypothetical protein